MILNAYGEISLPELAEKTKKSKSTISKHLNELENSVNWITIREEKVRGAIKKKIYRMNVKKTTSDIFWYIDQIIKSFPPGKSNELLIKILKLKSSILNMIQFLNIDAVKYLERNMKYLKTMDHEIAKGFFLENDIPIYGINLSSKEAEEYNSEIKKFHKEFFTKIETVRLQNKEKIPVREYFAFNIVFPMKKIILE